MSGSPDGRRVRLAVLTCSELGYETARALSAVEDARVVAVVHAPPRSTGWRRRLQTLRKRQGLPGVIRAVGRKVLGVARRLLPGVGAAADFSLPPGVRVVHCDDFHSESCLSTLRDLQLDLAVVDGTYILKERVFDLPREGSINIHCGKLPEYRGAPPAFWELLQGETEVGVTIHRVSEKVDEGPVLRQELRPLDPAPPGDPMDYIASVWRDELRPAAIRMVGEVVTAMAEDRLVEEPQRHDAATTYRFPDYATVRALRKRVRERRREGPGGER